MTNNQQLKAFPFFDVKRVNDGDVFVSYNLNSGQTGLNIKIFIVYSRICSLHNEDDGHIHCVTINWNEDCIGSTCEDQNVFSKKMTPFDNFLFTVDLSDAIKSEIIKKIKLIQDLINLGLIVRCTHN